MSSKGGSMIGNVQKAQYRCAKISPFYRTGPATQDGRERSDEGMVGPEYLFPLVHGRRPSSSTNANQNVMFIGQMARLFSCLVQII